METNHFITEESVTIKDFERVCRTCLSTIDLQPISEVFDLGYFPVEIALSKYTQVQFDPSDKLPQQICSNCVKNLNNSYSFLLNCDLVNTSLKECLARYESNLQTTCLPNEIEYVNCQIKEEPVEFEFSETNENAAVPPSTVNENLHTAVEIKEEAANNSVDENDSDNFDSDGDQIITNVPRSGGETDNSIPKKKTKPEMERSTFTTDEIILNVGKVFDTDEELTNVFNAFCKKYQHPFVVRTRSERQITYKCCRGIKQTSKSGKRANYEYYYKGCTAQVNLYKGKNNKWKVTKLLLDHNHIVLKADCDHYSRKKTSNRSVTSQF